MTEHDSALELLGLVTNADLYKQRIAEFAKLKLDAEQAVERAEKAKQEADEFVRLAERTRQEHTAHIVAAQGAHDRAAQEAEARINLANSQVQGLQKLREELAAQETDLKARERVLKSEKEQVAKDKQQIKQDVRVLREAEEKLSEKIKRIQAAIA